MEDSGQVLACADDVNLIGNGIKSIEKRYGKHTGLAVNIGKTKNMEVRRHWGLVANYIVHMKK